MSPNAMSPVASAAAEPTSKFLDLEISIGRISTPTNGVSSQQLEKAALDHIYFCIVNGDVDKLQKVVEDSSIDIGQLQLQVR